VSRLTGRPLPLHRHGLRSLEQHHNGLQVTNQQSAKVDHFELNSLNTPLLPLPWGWRLPCLCEQSMPCLNQPLHNLPHSRMHWSPMGSITHPFSIEHGGSHVRQRCTAPSCQTHQCAQHQCEWTCAPPAARRHRHTCPVSLPFEAELQQYTVNE